MSDAQSPDDLFRARIRAARKLTPEQRVMAGFEQSEVAMRVVADGIRDQHPHADEATVERLLIERVDLMRKRDRRPRYTE